jgi:hypothetical protein
MTLELKAGKRVKIREQYTVNIGGDLFQGGETIPVTAKNVDELEQQRWKLEAVPDEDKKDKSEDDSDPEETDTDEDKKKTKTKQVKDDMVTNRAILDPKESRKVRTRME